MNELNNPSNLTHIVGLLLREWEKVEKNDQTACDALEAFKVESRNYMKQIQRKEHNIRMESKKNSVKVLELDSGHSEEEKSLAAKTLHEQAKIDLIGKIIRSKGDLRNKSKPTPSHFAAATYRHKSSIMTEVIDKNNNLRTTQPEIENAHVDMWKDVFRNRNTSTAARDKVLSELDRTLPNEATTKNLENYRTIHHRHSAPFRT